MFCFKMEKYLITMMLLFYPSVSNGLKTKSGAELARVVGHVCVGSTG